MSSYSFGLTESDAYDVAPGADYMAVETLGHPVIDLTGDDTDHDDDVSREVMYDDIEENLVDGFERCRCHENKPNYKYCRIAAPFDGPIITTRLVKDDSGDEVVQYGLSLQCECCYEYLEVVFSSYEEMMRDEVIYSLIDEYFKSK